MRRWIILLLLLAACQSEPEAPLLPGFLQGDFAFIPYQNYVQVIDIANETEPTFVTEFKLPGNVMKVIVNGRFLYIAHSTNATSWDSRTGPPNAGLQIVDISDPAQPQFRGFFYTKNLPTDLALYNDIVYLSTAETIDIIRVRNEGDARHIGTFFEGGNSLMRHGEQLVAGWGGCSFRSGYCGGGFNLFDLSEPDNIIQIAHFQLNEIPGYDVALANGHAFGAGKGMWVTNLANLEQLQVNGRYEQDSGLLHPSQILVEGNTAYLTQFQGVHILDISEPSSPQLLSIHPTSNQITDLVLRNGRLYLTGWSGLEIIDVSEPKMPQLIGYYATDYPAQIFPQPTATP